MATKITLGTSLRQQIKLSPAQIQAMRMLEIPTCELQARINEELQNNPALEEGKDYNEETNDTGYDEREEEYENPLQNKDFNYDIYIQDDEPTDFQGSTYDRPHEDIPFSMGISFHEYLKSQIYLTKMNKADRHIAKFVVGNIEDNGYLRRTVEELVDDLSFRENLIVSDAKMQEIVDQIKEFDPVGVGARDTQECLLIQLKKRTQSPSVKLAIKIITHHLASFQNHQFNKIYSKLGITEEEFKQAYNEIKHLNPYPSNAWMGTSEDRAQSIVIPDFIVEQGENDFIITLSNGNISELHVSKDYQQMLEQYSLPTSKANAQTRETAKFIKTNVDGAKYFIDAIRQRNETMMRSIEVLVALQHEFFTYGDSVYLKPLTLKDVAERTGYDISTISRTFSNKYVQTEFGIFPLKYFFSDKITNSKGQKISTREVKEKLRDIIKQENKTNPITDDQLVEIMQKEGYHIARRTVSKYREQLGILTARSRRQFF